jgi:hypothetical protein
VKSYSSKINPDSADVVAARLPGRSGATNISEEGIKVGSASSLMSWQTTPSPQAGQVAVMVLAQLKKRSLPWGYGRFALNHLSFRRMPGLCFAKMMGCGYNGGFGLRPSLDRQALFLLFNDDAAAVAALASDPLLQQYRLACKEFFSVLLDPYAVKGSWSGHSLKPTALVPDANVPMAALTRASIRTSQLRSFWHDAKPAHQDMATARGCLLSAGVGELPVVRQATFTLWENLGAMNQYARAGAHQTAIVRAHSRDYFTESMFVRFIARDATGMYKGRQYGSV